MSTVLKPPTKGVLIVAPAPQPYGGMALQASLLQRMLEGDGVPAEVLSYNQQFRPSLRWIEKVPALRAIIRTALFCARFWRRSKACAVVHVFACSWLYFLLVVSPSVVTARIRRKRVILNYRGGDADAYLRRFGSLSAPVFRLASVVTAPSPFLASVIRNRIGVAVDIVPNIIDFSTFRYRQRSSLRPRLLVTRHLEELYGIETVLRAFRHILSIFPEATLWIAGTGSQEPYLRRLLAQWRLRNVSFLGHIDHDALPDIYDQCDILLNASKVDNFPASLMEASAAGLVVVSTRAGGIPVLYQDGQSALLVDIDDPEALAAAVQRVLTDKSLGYRLAAGGRTVCAKCEWSGVSESLYATYQCTFQTQKSDSSRGQIVRLASVGVNKESL